MLWFNNYSLIVLNGKLWLFKDHVNKIEVPIISQNSITSLNVGYNNI